MFRHSTSLSMASDCHVLLLASLLVLLPCHAFAQPSPPSDNYLANPNFNPSMAIVIVVLISAFFFLGFFSIYFRQCAGEGDYFGGSVRGAGVRFRRQQTQRGLSKEVLETFPTLVYSEVKELKIGKGVLECAVCLTEFEDDDKLRLLPGCSHVFHPDCIDAWLSSHVTCPVCRANLAEAAEAAADHDQDARELAPAAANNGSATENTIPPPGETGVGERTPPDQVVIVVDRTEAEEEERQRKQEAAELAQLGSRRREYLSRSVRRPQKLPRSHSTGHSVALPRECTVDRYTLRLPEHVRKEIFAARKFHRSASCVAFPSSGDGSSRPGYRYSAGEGSSRGGRSIRLGKSDRWPSFLVRTLSARFPSWAGGRRGVDGEGSVKKGEDEGSTNRGKFAAVMTPLDCLVGGGAAAADAKGDDESATAVLARRV